MNFVYVHHSFFFFHVAFSSCDCQTERLANYLLRRINFVVISCRQICEFFCDWKTPWASVVLRFFYLRIVANSGRLCNHT